MTIPIIIDTGAIAAQFNGIGQEQIDNMCNNIAKSMAASFAGRLEEEANLVLHQTRRRYVNAISLVDEGRLSGTVLLDFSKDPVVGMIEQGASAFDQKESMLRSSKVKIGNRGGKYITIPFRFSTPDAVADSDVFSSKLPEEVYEVLKNKETNIATGSGTRSEGLKTKELPVQFQSPKVRAEIKDSAGKKLFDAYTHKTSIYTGAIKTKDGVTGQNSYNSFRRISENSDKNAWIHPGIEKHNLVGKALTNFNQERELSVLLSNALSQLGLQ